MFFFFLRYLRPYIAREILTLLLLIFTSILALATPYVIKLIIDDIFPTGNYVDLLRILSVLLGIYVLRIIGNLFFEILYTRLNQSIINDIRIDLFSRILNGKIFSMKKAKIGELVFLLKDDVESIQDGLSSFGLKIANNCVTILGILIMLFTLNTELALLSLLILPFIILSTKAFLPKIRLAFGKVQEIDSEIHDYFFERLKNIRVIKSYNTESYEKGKAYEMHDKLVKSNVKVALVKGVSNHLTGFMIAVGPLFVLLYGGKQVFENLMTLGALIAFLQYLNKLYSPMLNLINSYNELEKAKVSMLRVYKYFSPKKNFPRILSKSQEFETLTLSDISLEYNSISILENVNLEMKAGKIYGIIGPSGSGKTSLIDLICGFVQPSKGKILLNQTNNIYDIQNWNQFYALIEKENQLFSGDILTNIKYGISETRYGDITKVIRFANLQEVIENLEFKEKTELSNNASILSDGQKQRISISRALLKKAPILIIDEATSSLDTKTERLIFNNIKSQFPNTLIIFITHRPSSLQYCDDVYELRKKKLHLV